ncbi:hypothetical protein BDDG_12148 [Blastomyces dermatitidis ATCC 18188]|uniref:Uncharacterized protein n=1 Tax=Ajellomyces dermatitidis (strain ATCC 18188 / CBS 674.68) TaxID=653446 RepID=A0A0J9EQM7_AJEDA|nr:hypothetical protein BDDG_12148 [Blastomyces dermatitidis ATCC 18188]
MPRRNKQYHAFQNVLHVATFIPNDRQSQQTKMKKKKSTLPFASAASL